MGFRIHPASGEAQLDALFRLRHRVFAEEKRYNQSTADGRLRDPIDELPGALNVVATADGEVVGGIRFHELGAAFGPTDGHFEFAPHLPAGARAAVGNLLVTLPAWRRTRGAAVAMLATGYHWLTRRGFTHVVALMAPDAESFARHMGAVPVSPRIPYAGEGGTALPVVIPLHALGDAYRAIIHRHSAPFLPGSLRRGFFRAGEELKMEPGETAWIVARGEICVTRADGTERYAPGSLLDGRQLGARMVAVGEVEVEILEDTDCVGMTASGEVRRVRGAA